MYKNNILARRENSERVLNIDWREKEIGVRNRERESKQRNRDKAKQT